MPRAGISTPWAMVSSPDPVCLPAKRIGCKRGWKWDAWGAERTEFMKGLGMRRALALADRTPSGLATNRHGRRAARRGAAATRSAASAVIERLEQRELFSASVFLVTTNA